MAELKIKEMVKGQKVFVSDTKIYNIFSIYEGEVQLSETKQKIKKDLIVDIFENLCHK